MGNVIVTKEDFYNITWENYNEIAVKLGKKIKSYCLKNGYTIDCVVPILRGGGVLGIHLSHILNVVRMEPFQYKYMLLNNEYVNVALLEPKMDTICEFKNNCVLVTEGNHCSGTTAQKCIHKIRQSLPTAKIIYACLVRDVCHLKPLDGTTHEIYGILSNDSKMLTEDYCEKNGIPNKFGVFPWESVEEEIREVNSNANSNME